jgi:methylated-DNA-protein-cysteine methyltransferase-like protein
MKDNYQELVYECTRKIPNGKVCTYGLIADFLGLGSARMVGWALNKSFNILPEVPAHRVVNRKGELSGRNHFSSPDLMQLKLEAEGIQVKDDKIINFQEVLWKPKLEDFD